MSGEPKSFTSQNSASPFGLCVQSRTLLQSLAADTGCVSVLFLLAIRRQPLSLEWLEEPRSDRLFYEDFFMGTEIRQPCTVCGLIHIHFFTNCLQVWATLL